MSEKEPLQNFANSDYERPSQAWSDVGLNSGDETDRGDHEAPVRRERSLRSRRGIFTFAVTAFVVGATMILFNSSYRNEFLAPGPLSSTHAQILAGHGADRCAACHGAGNQSFATWFADAISGGRKVSACQSDLCMECHKNSLNGDYAMLAHNVDPAVLAEMTAAKAENSPFRLASFPGLSAPVSNSGEIACSSCHREHHGTKSLSELTDVQCQTCHGSTIHSFETDHPEFNLWPVNRRSRIAFDHTSHGLKHFPGKATTFDCAQCHVDDERYDAKLLAPFEQSCAACHEEQILESSDKTFALFALPMLDLDAITAAGGRVGEWPESATGDFDGDIPGVMRMLLAADDQAAPLLAKLGNEFSFADVDPEDSQMVLDACELVWSIKRLLNELSTEGRESVWRRLETSLGRSVAPNELNELLAGLNAAVFSDAARQWMPGLVSEMATIDAGLLRPRTRSLAAISDKAALFRYAPQGDELLAVNPLKDHVKPGTTVSPPSQTTVQTTAPTTSPDPDAPPVPPGYRTPAAMSPPATVTPLPAADSSGRVVNNFLNDGGNDFLAENPLKKLMSAGSAVEPVQLPVVNSGSSSSIESGSGNTSPEQQQSLITQPALSSINPGNVSIVANSGWVRNDLTLQIGYRPSGHEDRTIRSWTTLVTGLEHADTRFDSAALFAQLTNPLGIGNCRSCHTVDQSGDAFVVNWKGETQSGAVRAFTKFSHGPHLVQPHLQDCSYCHTLNADSPSADTYGSFDSSNAVTNFHPIVKSNCASCHQEGQTDNSCSHCHNYHVGSRITESGQ